LKVTCGKIGKVEIKSKFINSSLGFTVVEDMTEVDSEHSEVLLKRSQVEAGSGLEVKTVLRDRFNNRFP
jgi:hypothetical protein